MVRSHTKHKKARLGWENQRLGWGNQHLVTGAGGDFLDSLLCSRGFERESIVI